MKDVTYVGGADTRKISSAQWKKLGINSKDTEWKKGETLSIANGAAEYLAENEVSGFVVEGDPVDESTGRRLERQKAAAERDDSEAASTEGEWHMDAGPEGDDE